MHAYPATSSGGTPATPLLLSDRFQSLARPKETTESRPEFRAQGVYKPPQMRFSETVASTSGSDPTVNGTSTVHPGHGSRFCCEDKTTPRVRTPDTNPSPAPPPVASLEGLEKFLRQAEVLRKMIEEVGEVKNILLEQVQNLRSAGLTEEEIQGRMGRPINSPPGPPPIKVLDINTTATDFAYASPGHGNGRAQTERGLVKTLPPVGGPIHSLATRPGRVHQAEKDWYSPPITTLAHKTRPSALTQQTMSKEQAELYPRITSHRRPVSSVGYQTSCGTYQTPASSSISLPPRFCQPSLLGTAQNRRKTPVPVSLLPVLPQNGIPGENVLFSTQWCPKDRKVAFDFERVARSSNCSDEIFLDTYRRETGVQPGPAASYAWTKVVERVTREKLEQQCEFQFAMERHGKESRLRKWLKYPSGFDPRNFSPFDASTKGTSSRDSVTGEERSAMKIPIRSNEKRKIGAPQNEREWKNCADKTWVHGGPEREDDLDWNPSSSSEQDDPEFYRVVQENQWLLDPPRD